MQNYNNPFVLQTKMRTIFKNNISGFSICKRFSEKCLQIGILPYAILFKMKRPLSGGEKSSSFHLSAHSAAVFYPLLIVLITSRSLSMVYAVMNEICMVFHTFCASSQKVSQFPGMKRSLVCITNKASLLSKQGLF